MKIEQALLQALDKLERDLQAKKMRVERELAEVEDRRLRLLAERDVIIRFPERRLSFNPVLGRGYQCPDCWINSGTTSRMRQVPSGDGNDLALCDACGLRVPVEVDGRDR